MRAAAWFIVAAAFLSPVPVLGTREEPESPPDRPTEDEAAAYFAWFDGLVPPGDWGKPFITFTCGSCSKSDDGTWEASKYFGVLAEDGGSAFRVLTLELGTQQLTRADGLDTPEGAGSRVGFAHADLDAFVADRLHGGWTAIQENARGGSWSPESLDYWVPEEVRYVGLARACWARGRREFARDLLHVARRLASDFGGRALRGDLDRYLGGVLFGWTVKTLPDPSVGRPELLARIERLAEEFKETDEGPTMAACAAVLRRMVAEEATHRPPEGFPDRCSPEQQAREWVWRLREQGGIQLEQPGFCDLFAVEGKAREPVDSLLALGERAIPALLEVLDDERWTRGLEGRGEPLRPFTFGDAARQILLQISGRSFETKESAMAWWSEVQEKGMEAVLVEGVRRGDRESPNQAKELMKRFPGSAVSALMAGLRAATDGWERGYLVYLLGGIEGDAPVKPLIEEAMNGPILDGRLEAARALHKRGRPEGLAGWIHTLETMDLWSGVYRFDDLLEDLVGAREPTALQALGRKFPGFDLAGKVAILDAIVSEARKEPSAAREWREAAEALCASAALDPCPKWRRSRTEGDPKFDNLRVRDLAAARLARLRGDPTADSMPEATCRRDGWVLAILNAWRRSRGLDPLPDPPRPSFPPADPAVAELLRVAMESDDEEARTTSVARLRDLGLGALAPAEDALRGLPASHPARSALEAAVRALAFHIRTVEVDAGGLPAPETVKARLRGLCGQPLPPEGIVRLLTEAVRTLPAASSGVEIHIDRPGNGTGCSLVVGFPRRSRAGDLRRPEQWMWNGHWCVLSPGREPDSGGMGSTRYRTPFPSESEWEPLATTLERVLELPPDVPVDFELSLSRE